MQNIAKRRRRHIAHLIREFLVVVMSVALAFVLVKVGAIESFIDLLGFSKILSSIIAGAFFTSIFTVAPAALALIALSGSASPVLVAFFGAVGAVTVDLFVISIVRKGVVKDVEGFAPETFHRRIIRVFHFGFLKWVAFAIGMILVATPLPDEFGLFLISLSKADSRILPVVSFLAHFLGIFAIISVASAI